MPRPDAETLAYHKVSGATHVIVVCDTFSYEDYCVPVMPGEDLETLKSKYNGKEMQRIMEVIELQSELEAQVSMVNAQLRELQEEYKVAFEPTKAGFQVRLLQDNKGNPRKRSHRKAA